MSLPHRHELDLCPACIRILAKHAKQASNLRHDDRHSGSWERCTIDLCADVRALTEPVLRTRR